MMDVGQIIGATPAPPPRSQERSDSKGEDFSSLLTDHAAARDRESDINRDSDLKKTDSAARHDAAPASEDSARSDSKKQTAAHDSKTKETASNDRQAAPEAAATAKEGEAAQTAKDKAKKKSGASNADALAAAAPQPAPALPPAGPVKAAAANTDSPSADAAKAALAANVGKAAEHGESKAAKKETKNTDGKIIAPQMTEQAVKDAPATTTASAKATEKSLEPKIAEAATPTAKPETPAPATAPKTQAAAVVPPQGTEAVKSANIPAEADALAQLRADAADKFSEKDKLSNKIAEMLRNGKGNIRLVSSDAKKPSFQSTLASSTNLVSASLANGAQQNVKSLTTDGVAGQAATSAVLGGQPTGAETVQQPLPTHHAAIQGVDATSANSTAQAGNAARVLGHVPVAEQLSPHIGAAIKEGSDHIKINLHPSELGRVEVKLEVGHDGRVIATIAVDKQHTLDMLQRDAHSLERSLQDAGFQTGSNSLNFGLRQDNANQQFAHSGGDGRPMAEQIDATEDMIVPASPAALSNSGLNDNGNLDIQV